MKDPADNVADWLAWGLQFAVGFIVGAVLGFFAALRVVRGYPLLNRPDTYQLLICTAGVALLGAGLASWFGDELWLGSETYRTSPPEGPRQSRVSAVISIATALLGTALVVLVVLRQMGII